MSSWADALRAAGLFLVVTTAAAQGTAHPGIGRAATPAEVKAWDIDVRPDFKGLPPGRGSVAQGQVLWEARCASCHGVFGESNEVFAPLIGGTTAADIARGRVARLTDPGFPGRTTLMKLPTLSTLWDYIHRAMPWNAPRSLSPDEVYAVTAFMLNLGGVVPDDFTLSQDNMAQVQARLPNRNGMTTDHALWPGAMPGDMPGDSPAGRPAGQRPDVRNTACMAGCGPAPKIVSQLPPHAQGSHGNLADQQRLVGAQRGWATRGDASTAATAAPRPAAASAGSTAQALARQHNCLACHGIDNKLLGPALRDVARRYSGRADAADYLAQRISGGGGGVWGAIPMPAQTLPGNDVQAIAQWLADGAPP